MGHSQLPPGGNNHSCTHCPDFVCHTVYQKPCAPPPQIFDGVTPCTALCYVPCAALCVASCAALCVAPCTAFTGTSSSRTCCLLLRAPSSWLTLVSALTHATSQQTHGWGHRCARRSGERGAGQGGIDTQQAGLDARSSCVNLQAAQLRRLALHSITARLSYSGLLDACACAGLRLCVLLALLRETLRQRCQALPLQQFPATHFARAPLLCPSCPPPPPGRTSRPCHPRDTLRPRCWRCPSRAAPLRASHQRRRPAGPAMTARCVLTGRVTASPAAAAAAAAVPSQQAQLRLQGVRVCHMSWGFLLRWGRRVWALTPTHSTPKPTLVRWRIW